MVSKSQTTREHLCEAAIRTASRDGLMAMTLDNVAREAGVSKGGVMYHFPTKDKLILEMIEYFGQRVERMIVERVALDSNPHNRWARAMISAMFPGETDDIAEPGTPTTVVPASGRSHGALNPELLEKFFLAMLAMAVNNPGLLEPLRAVGRRVQERLLSDPDSGFDQLFVWLAMDGLILWRFAGLINRGDPLYQQIGAELHRRVSGRDADPAAPPKSSKTPAKSRSRKRPPRQVDRPTVGRSTHQGESR